MSVELSTILISVITFISPLITSLFTKVTMSSKAKTVVALVVSAVISVGYVFFTGGFEGATLTDFAAPLAVVFGTMQAVYQLLLKKLSKETEVKVGLKPKTFSKTPAKG